jgi:hypothetical protein
MLHFALVLNGIYSPQPPKQPLGVAAVDGRTGQSDAPPDTIRCASHVTQPLGFEQFRPLELCLLVAPDRHCSLSGAPLAAALTSVRTIALQASIAVDRCAGSRCSVWCTGQSDGTPDSPVNYSGVALEKHEGG